MGGVKLGLSLGIRDCHAEFGNCRAGMENYRTRFGMSRRISNCHAGLGHCYEGFQYNRAGFSYCYVKYKTGACYR